MSAIVSLYYGQPLYPADSRVGQDSIELAASIFLAFISGSLKYETSLNAFGSEYNLFDLIQILLRPSGDDGEGNSEARMQALAKIITALGAVGTAVVSLVTALKSAGR